MSLKMARGCLGLVGTRFVLLDAEADRRVTELSTSLAGIPLLRRRDRDRCAFRLQYLENRVHDADGPAHEGVRLNTDGNAGLAFEKALPEVLGLSEERERSLHQRVWVDELVRDDDFHGFHLELRCAAWFNPSSTGVMAHLSWLGLGQRRLREPLACSLSRPIPTTGDWDTEPFAGFAQGYAGDPKVASYVLSWALPDELAKLLTC